MRVLLTGSSGWLGRYLAPHLTAVGHESVGLDVVDGPHTQHVGSVADGEFVRRIVRDARVEAIIHAGALHKPDVTRYSEQAFVDVNITGTLNLLQAARDAGHTRFVLTSTTSVMVTQSIHEGRHEGAAWLDERSGPLAPRNIYGVTKLAAEGLCRQFHRSYGLSTVVLRTSRFFPEDDDSNRSLPGPNLKANEFLHRRLTVEDAARAHVAALDAPPDLGHEVLVISAPPPFEPRDARELRTNATAVISRYHPSAREVYARLGWELPAAIDRVYDPRRAEELLGYRCRTDFAAVLEAVSRNEALPFVHDPAYTSPKESRAT